MILIKFYPDASEYGAPERIRTIQKDILAALKNYHIESVPVYNGMRGGYGPCYALNEVDDVELVRSILEDFEPVYSVQTKDISYRGVTYSPALLVRLG